jgi:hypothetical protein
MEITISLRILSPSVLEEVFDCTSFVDSDYLREDAAK